jgi:hypothetical protein
MSTFNDVFLFEMLNSTITLSKGWGLGLQPQVTQGVTSDVLGSGPSLSSIHIKMPLSLIPHSSDRSSGTTFNSLYSTLPSLTSSFSSEDPQRIDTLAIKHSLHVVLGDRASTYWNIFQEFLVGRMTRTDFDGRAIQLLGHHGKKCCG